MAKNKKSKYIPGALYCGYCDNLMKYTGPRKSPILLVQYLHECSGCDHTVNVFGKIYSSSIDQTDKSKPVGPKNTRFDSNTKIEKLLNWFNKL